MTIQELAAFRMVEGKKNHPDQTWPMERKVMNAELKEELADAYNYAEGHEDMHTIRSFLAKIWNMI